MYAIIVIVKRCLTCTIKQKTCTSHLPVLLWIKKSHSIGLIVPISGWTFIFSHSFSLLQNLSKFHRTLVFYMQTTFRETWEGRLFKESGHSTHKFRLVSVADTGIFKPEYWLKCDWIRPHSVDWKLRFHLVSQNYYSDWEEVSKIDAARRQVVLTFLGQMISPPTIIRPRLSMPKMLHFLFILSSDWLLRVQNSLLPCRLVQRFQSLSGIY